MLQRAIPVLGVSRAAAAEAFYCGRLGFRRLFAYRPDESRLDPCYMGLEREGVVLHVSSFPGDGGSGGVVFVLVDDVDALHAEFVAKGIPIAMEPTDQTWGLGGSATEDALRMQVMANKPFLTTDLAPCGRSTRRR